MTDTPKRRTRPMPRGGEAVLCSRLAHGRVDCNQPAVGGTVPPRCKMHLGYTVEQARKEAQQRIIEAADPAAAYLARLVDDTSAPANVRLQAARDLLDRAGLGATHKTEVTTVDATDAELRRLIAELGTGASPVPAEPSPAAAPTPGAAASASVEAEGPA